MKGQTLITHTQEIIKLGNWIYNLHKEKDYKKIEKLQNVINRMKIRRLLNNWGDFHAS